MLMPFLRVAAWRTGAALFAAMSLLVALPATAGTYAYGPGGLPDLTAYPIGRASFDAMAADLGTPVGMDADGSNHVTTATWWLPAQGYSAPTATTTGQRAAQAASSGFFSRLRSQAVGTVSGLVPGVGGVIAGQAANAVAASAVPGATAGQAVPGWWCRAVFPTPGYRLSSVSCSPHAYTPAF
jgi:hypothetical protein